MSSFSSLTRFILVLVVSITVARATLLPAVFSGTYEPGTYTIGAAAADNTPVYLDCQNNPASVFTFIIGGALSVNANITPINGLCTINWEVNGAVTVAAGIFMYGNIQATGAITYGAGTVIIGALTTGVTPTGTNTYALSATASGYLLPGTYTIGAAEAINSPMQLDCENNPANNFTFIIGGALSVNANVETVNGQCNVNWQVNGAVSVAAGDTLAGNVAATGAVSLGANAEILGNVATPGAITQGAGSKILGTTSGASTHNSLGATFSGTLEPGTYTIGAAAAANAPVYLDCKYSAASTFLFVIGGALSINANVLPINGLCSVTWQVDGAVTVAANTDLYGTVQASGAVTVGAGGLIIGSVTSGASGTFHLGATFSGILTPGTYTIGAASANNAPAFLNCENSTASTFLFVIGGALSVNANILPLNGLCHVTWQVNGAVTVAAGTELYGNVVATGAVTTGAGGTIVPAL
jgi:predicted acyltransferase (DUF342 family)